MNEEIDLFDKYTELPTDVCAIIDRYAYSDNTYETCESMLQDMEELGYTFDYDLDAQPYNLRKKIQTHGANIGKILKNETHGCFYMVPLSGGLYYRPMVESGQPAEEWQEVEDFYPGVVKSVNEFYGTHFKVNA